MIVYIVFSGEDHEGGTIDSVHEAALPAITEANRIAAGPGFVGCDYVEVQQWNTTTGDCTIIHEVHG